MYICQNHIWLNGTTAENLGFGLERAAVRRYNRQTIINWKDYL